jgi:hypothetical protein
MMDHIEGITLAEFWDTMEKSDRTWFGTPIAEIKRGVRHYSALRTNLNRIGDEA